MPASRLAHPRGMKISTFQEHTGRFFRAARIQAAKHTRNAHRFFFIANHQVAFVELALHAVQSDKRRAFRQSPHADMAAFHFRSVKTMQRLPKCMHNIVGHVHHIVDGTKPNGLQTVLQPFRAFFHGYAAHRHSCITRASFRVLHRNGDIKVMILYLERIHGRFLQMRLVAMLH